MKLDKALIGYVDLMHPGLVRLPVETQFLHVQVLAWCATFRTNGAVLREQLPNITRIGDPESGASALVTAGVWEATPDGWRLDWTEQIGADEAQRITDKNRARWKAFKRHERGDHGEWCPRSCKSRADNAADTPVDTNADTGVDNAVDSVRPNLTSPNRTGPTRTDPPGIGRIRSESDRHAQQVDPVAAPTRGRGNGRRTPKPAGFPVNPATIAEAVEPYVAAAGTPEPYFYERAAALVEIFGAFEVARHTRRVLSGLEQPYEWLDVYAATEVELHRHFPAQAAAALT